MTAPDRFSAATERARVAIVGLEPWGFVTAAALAQAGVTELAVLDDRPVGGRDEALLRPLGPVRRGAPRSEELAAVLRRAAPWTRVAPGALVPTEAGTLTLPGGTFDAVVGAAAATDLALLLALARAAHRRGVPSVYGSLQGRLAVVGPGVVPGSTACWNCYHFRRTAAVEDPWAADALDRALRLGEPLHDEGPPSAAATGLLGSLLALETLGMLSTAGPSPLAGRVIVQDLLTLQTSRHLLARLPWCSVCGGAAAADHRSDRIGGHDGGRPLGAGHAGRLDDTGSPSEVRHRLAGFVDPHVGIVRSVTLDRLAPDEPALPLSATASLSWWGDPSRGPDFAGGKGFSAGSALIGAVAEGLERYSASRVRPQDLRRASLDDLPVDSRLDPRDLGLYDAAQYARPGFPYARFDPARPLWWAQAWWVPSWRRALVPALAAHIDLPVPVEDDFVQVTSSGLGAGLGLEAAGLAAVFELIERDALMVSWLARRGGHEILPDASLGIDAVELVRELESHGVRLRLVALSAGVRVPVVACIGYGDGDRWPFVALSSAAGPDLATAARRALLEQGHAGRGLRRRLRSGVRPPGRPEDVRGPEEHALFFASPRRVAALDFLVDEGRGSVSISEVETEPVTSVEDCGQRLAEAGVELALADVTSPDLRTGPWRVVRALGAGAQSIHFGWGMERAANPRLQRFLAGPLNVMPHPLA